MSEVRDEILTEDGDFLSTEGDRHISIEGDTVTEYTIYVQG